MDSSFLLAGFPDGRYRALPQRQVMTPNERHRRSIRIARNCDDSARSFQRTQCLPSDDDFLSTSMRCDESLPTASSSTTVFGANKTSMSSNDLPFVSLITNQTYTASDQLKMQNMRNVFHPRLLTAWGVICEKAKLKSHWVAVPSATPVSRMRAGKISPVYTHDIGPHEQLYDIASR